MCEEKKLTPVPFVFAADVIYAGNGKDIAWCGAGNDVVLANLSTLLGVETAAAKDNGTRRARGDVLFGRERSEAANDAGYANTFGRKWA